MDINIGEIIKSTKKKIYYYLKMLRIEKFMNLNIVQYDGVVLSELALQKCTHLQKILYK
jgi:hypothetical protein